MRSEKLRREVEEVLKRTAEVNEVKAVHLLERLLPQATEVARAQKRCVSVEGKKVLAVGDLLGDFHSLSSALTTFKWDSAVLLGNYWDGGARNFGVLYALLKLFTLFPGRVVLLRGRSEHALAEGGRTRVLASSHERLKRYSSDIADGLLMFFNHLPVVALWGRVCFVNSGVPREWVVEREMKKGRNFPDYVNSAASSELLDFLFSEPTNSEYSELKGPYGSFGYNAFKSFSDWSGCERVVRGNVRDRSGFLLHFTFPSVPEDGRDKILSLCSTGRRSPHSPPIQVERPAFALLEGEGWEVKRLPL